MESVDKQMKDFDILLNEGVSFARSVLARSRNFDPFARVLRDGGAVEDVVLPGNPLSDGVVENEKNLRKMCQDLTSDGTVIAVALFMNVREIVTFARSTKEFDAIWGEIEHRLGHSVQVKRSYTKSLQGIELGELEIEKRDRRVFWK